MSYSKPEFDRAMERAQNSADRTLCIGAMLARSIGEEVIVVGGSAVDIYATGRQPCLDVDLVAPVSPAREVIETWGFERTKGQVWRREEIATDIDLVGRNFTGNPRKARTFTTPYGAVLVAAVEDLIAKRLSELKHWPTRPEWRKRLEEQATILLEGSGLDEEYLAFLAKRDDIADIMSDFRRRIGSAPGPQK